MPSLVRASYFATQDPRMLTVTWYLLPKGHVSEKRPYTHRALHRVGNPSPGRLTFQNGECTALAPLTAYRPDYYARIAQEVK